MRTYDDDFARLHLAVGTVDLPLFKMGLSWPPPERLYLERDGRFREAREDDELPYVMSRVSCSGLTNEQRDGMSHVARGAEYRYAEAQA